MKRTENEYRALEAEVFRLTGELSDVIAECNTYIQVLNGVALALPMKSADGEGWRYKRQKLSDEIMRVLAPAIERQRKALE